MESLTDINHWNEWDKDLQWTELKGETKLNADFLLKPIGAPKTRLTISQLNKPNVFADISHLPLAKIHTIHTLTQTSEGVKIQVDIKMSGILTFLWSKVIGQKHFFIPPWKDSFKFCAVISFLLNRSSW